MLFFAQIASNVSIFSLFHSFPFCFQSSILKIPQGANSKTLLTCSVLSTEEVFFPVEPEMPFPDSFSHSVYTEQEVEVVATEGQRDANELEKVKDIEES